MFGNVDVEKQIRDTLEERVMGKILIVDNNPTTRQKLRNQLTEAGYELFEAESGETALKEIKNTVPDVILVDEMNLGMPGSEVCQQLRSVSQKDLIYIIMLIAATESEHAAQGADEGADTYITKPVDIDDLLSRIRIGFHAITKKCSATVDALSGFYNRDFFNLYLVQEVERAQRYQRHLSLMLVDVDDFQSINDTYGHLVGDVILEEISKIVLIHCRQTDIPVRWGGEEFAILLPETELAGAEALAERIRQAIEAYRFEDFAHITASFGVGSLKTDEQDLLVRVESALYKAQKTGKNRVVSGG